MGQGIQEGQLGQGCQGAQGGQASRFLGLISGDLQVNIVSFLVSRVTKVYRACTGRRA